MFAFNADHEAFCGLVERHVRKRLVLDEPSRRVLFERNASGAVIAFELVTSDPL